MKFEHTMTEDWLHDCTTSHPFPLLPAGDGAAEALVFVPLTAQSAPTAAQLQAPIHLVAGG